MDWHAWWEFFAFLGSWWQRLDHTILAVGVGAAVWWLHLERIKLETAINTLGKQVEALKTEVEEGPGQPEPAATAEHWDQIRQMWADMRERMEYAIEVKIDRRKLRKYSTLQRYNYSNIITNLQRDFGLSPEAEDALQRMNSGFLSLRRAKAATKEHASWFWTYYQRADKVLPKIPGDTD